MEKSVLLAALNQISSPIADDILFDLNISAHDAEDKRNGIDTEAQDEDIIDWPLLTEKINRSTEKEIKLDFFEKFYIDFLLNLREGHSLPQNVFQSIAHGGEILIEIIHELLKIQIKNSSIKYTKPVNTAADRFLLLLNDVNKVIFTVL